MRLKGATSRLPVLVPLLLCILISCFLGTLLGLFSRITRHTKAIDIPVLCIRDSQSFIPECAAQQPAKPTSALTPITVVSPGETIQAGDRQVHIATSVHYSKQPLKHGFNLFLNGWARHNETKDFVCCLMHKMPRGHRGNITFTEVNSTLHNIVNVWIVDMQNAEFSCTITKKQLTAVGGTNFKYVTFADKSCLDAPPVVMEILQPKPVSNSIGVCLKVTYGKLDPEKMVEWFEYTRLMGVTKVFTYYFDVDPPVYKVLDYYKSIGYLDLLLMHPAKSKGGPERRFRHPRWSEQAWVDEVMAANDCKHRMAGFDYVIVMDIDEFILPKKNLTSFFDILKQAERKQPNSACFRFDSHIVMADWGITRNVSLHVTKYTRRTVTPNYDGVSRNVRWGFRPKLTHYVLNNYCYPDKPYNTSIIPEELYTLLHYRKCKKHWIGCRERSKIVDEGMVKYEVALVDRILNLPTAEVLSDNLKYVKALERWRAKVK